MRVGADRLVASGTVETLRVWILRTRRERAVMEVERAGGPRTRRAPRHPCSRLLCHLVCLFSCSLLGGN